MKHDEHFKVYFGDANDVLKKHIDDESIGAIIAGPPFFARCQTGVAGELGELNEDDFLSLLSVIFKQCAGKLVPGGKLLVQSGQIYLPRDKRTNRKIMNLPFDFYYKIISGNTDLEFSGSIHYYNKRYVQRKTYLGSYPYPCSIPITNAVEEMLVFSKSGRRQVSKEIKRKSAVSKEEFKEFAQPVWEFNEGGKAIESPLSLIERLIKFYSFEGDAILDPFIGYGTTLVAAMGLKRGCIGIEINSGFKEDIVKKLQDNAFDTRSQEVEFINV